LPWAAFIGPCASKIEQCERPTMTEQAKPARMLATARAKILLVAIKSAFS
jgi:hypothetical protein